MDAGNRLVDVLECCLQVELIQLVRQHSHILASFREGARHLRYVIAKQDIELLCTLVQVLRDEFCILDDEWQIRVGEQGVECCDECIDLCNDLFQLGNHTAHLCHETANIASLDGVARMVSFGRVGGKEHIERTATQHGFVELCGTAFGNAQPFVCTDFHNDISWVAEVVVDVAYNAHLVAVGIDGAALRQAFCVGEGDVILLAGTEEFNTLQEVNAEEECHYGHDSHNSYLYFCFHLYFLYATNAL